MVYLHCLQVEFLLKNCPSVLQSRFILREFLRNIQANHTILLIKEVVLSIWAFIAPVCSTRKTSLRYQYNVKLLFSLMPRKKEFNMHFSFLKKKIFCISSFSPWFYYMLCLLICIFLQTINFWRYSDQIRSVAQSCPILCNPMNHSTPGLPVHHQLPEFTQTHVHRVSDAIQPSYLLSSPSPLAPNPSQHQSLFQWVNSSHEVAKVLEFQL